MLYFDTSALMKLCRVEPESGELRRWLESKRSSVWVSSALTEIELYRAVARADPAAVSRVSEVLGSCALLEIDATIRQRAALLAPASLRSLDAIHLATALEMAGEVSACVTYDQRLADSSRSNGIPVESPGSAM